MAFIEGAWLRAEVLAAEFKPSDLPLLTYRPNKLDGKGCSLPAAHPKGRKLRVFSAWSHRSQIDLSIHKQATRLKAL